MTSSPWPADPSFEFLDERGRPPWQPAPGKRTLAQDLPLHSAAQQARDLAAVMAASSAEGARAGAEAAAATRVVEDPFALHLMSAPRR